MQTDDMKGWKFYFNEEFGTIVFERDFYDIRSRLQTLYIMSDLGSKELRGGGFKSDIEEKTHVHGDYDKVSKYINKKWGVDTPTIKEAREILNEYVIGYLERKWLDNWK